MKSPRPVNREGGAGRKASTYTNIEQRPRPCESRLAAVSVVHWIAPSHITRSANDVLVVHPSLSPCPIKDEQRTSHDRQRSVKPASVAGAAVAPFPRRILKWPRPHQPAAAGSSLLSQPVNTPILRITTSSPLNSLTCMMNW
mmetsp:Transcript_27665/g.45393  ORF Transcript_27665/g.45393 Transcript_27665/m.45393 type:complete len:142 (+) Transcript_27665:358-783(+)